MGPTSVQQSTTTSASWTPSTTPPTPQAPTTTKTTTAAPTTTTTRPTTARPTTASTPWWTPSQSPVTQSTTTSPWWTSAATQSTTASTWWPQPSSTTSAPQTPPAEGGSVGGEDLLNKPCQPGEHHPDKQNCNAYYRCILGRLKKEYCAGGLHWSATLHACDWPSKAGCDGGNCHLI
jgi:chitinase